VPEEAIIDEGQNQITYNVVLDPGDIARQAEEIRNKLDLALGVGSNAGAQFVNTTDFVNPQFAPLPDPNMLPMQGQFGNTFDQTFWQKAQAQANEMYQNLSTGVNRVRQDLSMLSDRTSTVIQRFQPEEQQQAPNPYGEMLPDSFGEYLLGSLGFGGDIKGPIPLSAYGRYSDKKLKEGVADVFQNPGAAYNEFTSTPVGMIANIGGYLLAPGAMLATDLAMLGDEFISGAYNKREDLAGGIREIARQQFGNISKTEARGLAQDVVNFTDSYQGYAQEYDLDEVGQNILQFGNMGGFSNVRNVDQLQEKLQTITEDTRQIARNLGVFQEDAINIMAELEQKSMVSVEEMRSMSDRMRFYGGVLKQSPTELLGEVTNTMEAFKQAPMLRETVAQSYIDAKVEAQQLVQSTDPYVQQSVYRLGGQSGVSQSLLNLYNRNQAGPLGQVMTMGQYFSGGTTGGNLQDNIDATSGGMQDYGDWMEFTSRGAEDVYGDKTLDEAVLDQISLGVGFWKDIMGQDTKINPRQLEGILMSQVNLTKDEARVVVEKFKQMTLDPEDKRGDRLLSGEITTKTKSDLEDMETTFWGEVSANFMNTGLLLGDGPSINEASKWLSYGWGDMKEKYFTDRSQDIQTPFGEITLPRMFGTKANVNKGTLDEGFLTEFFSTDESSRDIDLTEIQNPIYMRYLTEGFSGKFGQALETRMRETLKDRGKTEKEIERSISIAKNEFEYDDETSFLRSMYVAAKNKDIDFMSSREQMKIADQVSDLIETDKKLFYDDEGELLDSNIIVSNLLESGKVDFTTEGLSDIQKSRVIFQGMKASDDIGYKIKTEKQLDKDLEEIDDETKEIKDLQFEITGQMGEGYRLGIQENTDLFLESPGMKKLKKENPILFKGIQKTLENAEDADLEQLNEFMRGTDPIDTFLTLVKTNINEGYPLYKNVEDEKGNTIRTKVDRFDRKFKEDWIGLGIDDETRSYMENLSTSYTGMVISGNEKIREQVSDVMPKPSSTGRTYYEQEKAFALNFAQDVAVGYIKKEDEDNYMELVNKPEYQEATLDMKRQFDLRSTEGMTATIKNLATQMEWKDDDPRIKKLTEETISKMPVLDGSEVPDNINSMKVDMREIRNKYINEGKGVVTSYNSTAPGNLFPLPYGLGVIQKLFSNDN